jgi:hypothetical protein
VLFRDGSERDEAWWNNEVGLRVFEDCDDEDCRFDTEGDEADQSKGDVRGAGDCGAIMTSVATVETIEEVCSLQRHNELTGCRTMIIGIVTTIICCESRVTVG